MSVTPQARRQAPVVGLNTYRDTSHARIWSSLRRTARRSVTPLAALLIWQALSSSNLVDATFVPSPRAVLDAWWQWIAGPRTVLGWYSGTWFDYVCQSGMRVLLGFGIAAVLGIAVGIPMGWNETFADMVDPLIQILRPIPMTAWLPFATLFFGVRESAAVFLIAMGAFYTIAVNCAAGAQQTPKNLARAALMLGTPPHMLLFHVVLPSALPYVLTGLRLGLGVGWVLVIVVEMLAVKGGVGYAMWTAYQFVRTDIIIAAMATLGLMGLIADRILLLIGGYFLKWNTGLKAR
jgi:NitT/TauT family transport system permease protein